MHFVFIPYGKRSEVELLLRDMEAQKHALLMKKGNTSKKVFIQGQVRLLPLGVYEYVFPKEDIDQLLYTMMRGNKYNISKMMYGFLRKFYRLKKIPSYKKEKYYLWIKDNVNIIPLGIREDEEFMEPKGSLHEGFWHEAI